MAKLVGIVNVTPDSFSDGGLYLDPNDAVQQAERLFHEGASIVDIGAESTRPNADPVSSSQEWQRLEPVLTVLLKRYPGKVSLDSYHPETIRKAFQIGPVIINDVTGLNNPEMVKTVIDLNPPKVIISHHPNLPIQEAHQLKPISTMQRVKDDLLAKAHLLESNGIERTQIILDPGIGFGKTMELNRRLLEFPEQTPDYQVMLGYSRKRFLGEHRMELEPNLEAGTIALQHGAAYLRVHNIAGHKQLVT